MSTKLLKVDASRHPRLLDSPKLTHYVLSLSIRQVKSERSLALTLVRCGGVYRNPRKPDRGNIFQESVLLLWEKLMRLPDGLSLMGELHLDSGRRLKTQGGFVQGVLELKEQLDIDFVPEPLVSFLEPTVDQCF
ncbi:hypothetical protein TNCT_526121 [Trichonephila clavata]|uniref:Uncharacterized protein n=1 Tax=Trichonephila clavata TaxID=2740835 RepID=A0A8X6JQB9_TRICU|nr:hypothetical protein TNCT_526121 [Trichonephila clavata]